MLRPLASPASLAPLALATVAVMLAAPAVGLDVPEGATAAAGVGTISVWNGEGQLVCTDTAAITVSLAFGEVEVGEEDAPTGMYASVSSCATFVYPIATAYECAGGVGQTIRCDETGPPRWFTLDPEGYFLYERDNLGIHFEVWGRLKRTDAPA